VTMAVQPNQHEYRGPMVLQCKKCQQIVGDSTAYIAYHEELQSIALQSVSQPVVQEAEMPKTSRQAVDFGSTYVPLSCARCQVELGKKYLTTPKKLDAMRDLYALDMSALTCYELGECSSGTVDERTERLIERLNENASSSSDMATASMCLELKSDMAKVQKLLLVVEERLQELEAQQTDGYHHHP